MKNWIITITALLSISCSGQYLDEKPDKALVVPSSLADFRALLDNTSIMNLEMPNLGEIGSDDYYLPYEVWNSISFPHEKNAYIWAKDVYEGSAVAQDWSNRYRQVFYANNILEGIANFEGSSTANDIKGSALFFRAYCFFQLSQLFCQPYQAGDAASLLGIPLRLESDITKKTSRSSLLDTYQQVIADLEQATMLLGDVVSHKTRPSRMAAHALLARVYLTMQEYGKALHHAQIVIDGAGALVDLANIQGGNFPMARFNAEVIFHSTMSTGSILLTSRMHVDTLLFRSYDEKDLRKSSWYVAAGNRIDFRGSYDGSSQLFNGLSANEAYLVTAECLTRLNRNEEAEDVLAMLLKNRYVGVDFMSTIKGNPDLLHTILAERRKELPFRGIRWSDLRRLNLEIQTAKTLIRDLGGRIFELPSNSNNYVLPIQDDVIRLTGIPQNLRD